MLDARLSQRMLMVAATALLFVCAAARAESLAVDAAPRVVADTYKSADGLAAHRNGDVYFSDVSVNKIHRWEAATGAVTVHLDNAEGATGLFVNNDGVLFACQTASRRVVSLDAARKATVLADAIKGKKFAGPTDVWAHTNGATYFADGANGVFYISLDTPGSTKILHAAGGFKRASAVTGYRGGKHLYVGDAGAGKTYAFEYAADRTLEKKRVFCADGAVGLTMDVKRNVYVAPADAKAIHVYGEDGKLLEKLALPEPATSLCFGGRDHKTLLITTKKSLLALTMNVSGR